MFKKIVNNILLGALFVSYCSSIVPMNVHLGPNEGTQAIVGILEERAQELSKNVSSIQEPQKKNSFANALHFCDSSLIVCAKGYYYWLAFSDFCNEYLNLPLHEFLEKYDPKSGITLYSLDSLEESLFIPETIEAIKKVFAITKTSSDVKIVSGSDNSAAGNILTLERLIYRLNDQEAQEAIIAHECMHIKNRDSRSRALVSFAAPHVASLILKGYCISVDKLIAYLQGKYPDKATRLYKFLNLFKKINPILANNCIMHFILSFYIYSEFVCHQELRADYQAVLALKSVQGSIRAIDDLNPNRTWWQYFKVPHPSKERRLNNFELAQKFLDKSN